MSTGGETGAVALTLTEVRLGPVALPAPGDTPRQFAAAHGHLWQWVGDGHTLLTLTVAVRETRLGTPTGVRRHLEWEIDQVRAGLDAEAEPRVERDIPVEVDGASAAEAVTVDGDRDGMAIRHGLVVVTDGRHMHVVQVVATDTTDGRALVEPVMAGIRVYPWEVPR